MAADTSGTNRATQVAEAINALQSMLHMVDCLNGELVWDYAESSQTINNSDSVRQVIRLNVAVTVTRPRAETRSR